MQVTPTVHSDPQMRLDESLVIWTGATLRPRIPPSPRTSQPSLHQSVPSLYLPQNCEGLTGLSARMQGTALRPLPSRLLDGCMMEQCPWANPTSTPGSHLDSHLLD